VSSSVQVPPRSSRFARGSARAGEVPAAPPPAPCDCGRVNTVGFGVLRTGKLRLFDHRLRAHARRRPDRWPASRLPCRKQLGLRFASARPRPASQPVSAFPAPRIARLAHQRQSGFAGGPVHWPTSRQQCPALPLHGGAFRATPAASVFQFTVPPTAAGAGQAVVRLRTSPNTDQFLRAGQRVPGVNFR